MWCFYRVLLTAASGASGSSDARPTTSKGVPLPDLLTQLRHYSPQSRTVALQVGRWPADGSSECKCAMMFPSTQLTSARPPSLLLCHDGRA